MSTAEEIGAEMALAPGQTYQEVEQEARSLWQTLAERHPNLTIEQEGFVRGYLDGYFERLGCPEVPCLIRKLREAVKNVQ